MNYMKQNGKIRLRTVLLLSAALSTSTMAWAQDSATVEQPVPVSNDDTGNTTDNAEDNSEILVTGARQTQRSSNDMKRNATVIVDGLINDEIGSMPDNSVGDTLERLPGVTADRFKGNANELSVRGLGPTLSFSTFNGREVSTAGPDRSVAFQQFPSELINGVLVYKSQQADFLEGGIAGVIELRSIKPLDYGKRRFQAEFRGVFQPKDDEVLGRGGIGYRANISYTDQFSTGLGDIGVSIGYQRQDQAAPEDYYITNSSFVPCTTSARNPTVITGNQQSAAGSNVNCSNAAAGTTLTGRDIGDRYYATSARTFQNRVTSEKRDAVIGALQWRPAPNLDISLDGQYSKRSSLENRKAFAITEGLRGIQPLVIGGVGNDFSDGALLKYTGNSNLEIQMEDRLREEKYYGGGLNIGWEAGRLKVDADLSYSESRRTEAQKATNMRSGRRVVYTLDATEGEVPSVDFLNFDINDPNNFMIAAPANNSNYARYRFVTDRRDKIAAARVDATYELDGGFVQSLKFGARYSQHNRTMDANNNNDVPMPVPYDGRTAAQLVAAANANCRVPFSSTDFFSGSGTNLKSFALFDNDCVFRTYTGRDSNPIPDSAPGPEDSNVRERIFAAYVMANFKTELGSLPVSGNAGVRYVKTNVFARGYRAPVNVVVSVDGSAATVTRVPGSALEEISGSGSYDYFLPSVNLAFDLSNDVKLRLAGYKALSRSGIEDFNVGITPGADTTGTTVQQVLSRSTTGNPELKPMRGWNLDASLEFYPSRDTMFAVAGYTKWLKGAAFTAEQPFTTSIVANGQLVEFNAIAPANDPNTRFLYGFELSGSHSFTYLPSPLDGFGVAGSYSFTDADFEFPDPTSVGPYMEPANLMGLSRHLATGSVFWEKWGVSLRANYRYRSGYYKPTFGSTNRTVKGSGYLNLSAQYNVNDNIQLKIQALNVTGVRDIMYRAGEDSITEVSESGSQYYAGIRLRF